jgi:hypothetical protein
MATYYVRNDGSNLNTGTGSAANQAWQTITYALANMVLTSGTNYLYIAPGIYRESPTVTVTPSVSQTLVISGDPTASQFSGVIPNIVLMTNFASDNVVPTFGNILTCAKTYVTLQNVHIVGNGYTQFTSARNITLQNCVFSTWSAQGGAVRGTVRLATSANNPLDSTISKCIFYGDVGLFIEGQTTGSAYNFNTSVTDCLFLCNSGLQVDGPSYNTITVGNGVSIYNSVFLHQDLGVSVRSSNTTNPSNIRNCVLFQIYGGTSLSSNATGRLIEDYNRIASTVTRSGVDVGINSRTGLTGLDLGATMLTAAIPTAFFSPYLNSPLIGAGTSSGAPTTDQYGYNWTSGTDIGALARQTIVGASFYTPTERNASTITIAPGSTSQSIELYLGATGLTASTSGLSARYNRTRTASVSIPLVARTIAQAWTAGGFAEVDATNMPGIYRLDIPDAALAAGADDVTIVVRGASGTNGAVMTVKLSSGGLTSAQTASAVLDALTDDHQIHGTFGYNLLRADAPSKEGLVTLHQSGGVSRVDADIHAIANDTDAATELKGALLHNGTDYISAELLSPVSAATSVHIGPYQLLADGLGADQPLDVNVGTATSIDVQVTDANGTGIDITGSTVTAKVYNAGGTLVATYSGTATYADNGRLSFGLTTTVTNTSGTYTVTVTRTTGATDTQVFGPLKLYVRPV